jgi:hypothetical protein
MMVGFKAVHAPFTPMEEHANNYALNSFSTAPNWYELAPWLPRWQQKRRHLRAPIALDFWMDILRTVAGGDWLYCQTGARQVVDGLFKYARLTAG